MIEEIYEKKIQDLFAGAGVEMIVVRDGIIQAHTCGWNNPAIVDDVWQSPLEDQPVENRGKGWRRLQGFDLENAQAWAADISRI